MQPFRGVTNWVNWYEARGVYAPGTEDRNPSWWRDYGWLFFCWLGSVALFVVFLAVAT